MNDKVDIEIHKRKLTVEMEGLTPMQIAMLAGFVNDKMAEFQNRTKIVDSSKIAIYTALELAAELFKLQEAQRDGQRVLESRLDHMTEVLRASLPPSQS